MAGNAKRWSVASTADLELAQLARWQLRCAHCGRQGELIGHGYIRGYAEASSEQCIRGRRLLCARRNAGCGRTLAIWLAETLHRRLVRSSTLWRLLLEMRGGRSAGRAWRTLPAPSLTQRHARRLVARCHREQARYRSRCVMRCAPPVARAGDTPCDEWVRHLALAFAHPAHDSIACWQLALTTSWFAETPRLPAGR